jgi:hypothetical protein
MERMRALHSAGSIFGGAPILVENCFGLKIRHWRVAFGVRPRHFIPIQLPCWESYSYLESCTNGSKPSFVPAIEPVQTIRYICEGVFVPSEIPGTNVIASHLYRVEPRPGTNVSSFLRRGRGHLYWVEVPPDTNDVFFSFL